MLECELIKFKNEFFKEEIPNEFEFSPPHPAKNVITNIKK
ncbi:hypothetical protein LEP1GSC035_1156 [Leptospira noguchii str. 2007001578]|uniref:Uncharacterized protein n=1 Tax=Leptospira noguchii str. 2007001578 TaxID=1049974 RepID=A0ABN0IXR0_9LEPT|nr:hypothetical protein LEP1GSC035_1156 [Leptospira noguchii str. 2007001578]